MRRVLMRTALLAALLAVLAALALKYVFVLREITVAGNEGVAAEFVISASGLEPGQSMLRLNIETVKNGISALGTHKLERLEYHWPDGVRLVLRPRVRTAMALCAGGLAVLDGDCVVMEIVSDAPDRDLIYISGTGAQDARIGRELPMDTVQVEACKGLLSAISAGEANAYISEIDLSDADRPKLVLRNGCTAMLDGGWNMQQLAWVKAVSRDMERRGESGGVLQTGYAGHADFIPAQNMAK